MHLLDSRELCTKLFILAFEDLHLLTVALDDSIFLVKLSLENARRLLELCHLVSQTDELFFHHLQVVLCLIELFLLACLLRLHLETFRTWLGWLQSLRWQLIEYLVRKN